MRHWLKTISVMLSYSSGNGRRMIVLAALSGTTAGIASTALLSVINSALSESAGAHPHRVLLFYLLCIGMPLANICAVVLIMLVTARASRDMRMQLSRVILASPFSVLEQIGSARIVATLSGDIPALRDAITDLPPLISQLVIMLACLCYLGWLSLKLLPAVIAYMILGVLVQQLFVRRAMYFWKALRDAWDSMFKAMRTLTEGAKELKLHRRRRDEFLIQEVDNAAKQIYRNEVWGGVLTLTSAHGGQCLFYVFIGFVLFGAPLLVPLEHKILTGYVLTILFMIAPLSMILNILPRIGKASIAASKIESLGLSLTNVPAETSAPEDERVTLEWESVELAKITHIYRERGSTEEFCLGPIDLSVAPGELLFVIGGNGSGKTTLCKIIVGLYEPKVGEVRLNGEPVTVSTRDAYRQYFSVVFDDPYLFGELLGIADEEIERKASEYLRYLQLDRVVDIQNRSLSTIDLSRGQRKRLALLTAYLEDRPIYVFDEWASDQDPAFKQIFYLGILPELKARGKTAIVITHDDRYYSVADRVIRLERGQVVQGPWLGMDETDAEPLHGSGSLHQV